MGVLDDIEDLHNEEDLTIEEVKSTKGLENLSDEEAEKLIRDIKTFTEIIYELHVEINS